MNLTRENDGQNRRGEVAINAEKDRLLMVSLYFFDAKHSLRGTCLERVGRENRDMRERDEYFSLVRTPYVLRRFNFPLNACHARHANWKNATNSKRNERLEAGEKYPVRAFIK